MSANNEQQSESDTSEKSDSGISPDAGSFGGSGVPQSVKDQATGMVSGDIGTAATGSVGGGTGGPSGTNTTGGSSHGGGGTDQGNSNNGDVSGGQTGDPLAGDAEGVDVRMADRDMGEQDS